MTTIAFQVSQPLVHASSRVRAASFLVGSRANCPVKTNNPSFVTPTTSRRPHHHHHAQHASTISCVAPSPSTTPPTTTNNNKQSYLDQLVDTLLFFVKQTDGGASASVSDIDAINYTIDQIVSLSSASNGMPYTSTKDMYGDYVVMYSMTTKRQKSPPVGGLLRTRIGRLIFQSAGTFEHFIASDTVIQLLCFRFLGILPGCVSLKGRITFESGSNNMTFQFQRPRLCVGPLVFEYGPQPKLTTSFIYLDDRVRVMQGRRGSRFVFIRRPNGQFPLADKWKYVFNSKPLPAILLPILALACVAAAVCTPVPNAVRLGVLGFILIVAFILKRGGADKDVNNLNGTTDSAVVNST